METSEEVKNCEHKTKVIILIDHKETTSCLDCNRIIKILYKDVIEMPQV